MELSDAELAARRAAWKPIAPRYPRGVLAKYATLVGPACDGAADHRQTVRGVRGRGVRGQGSSGPLSPVLRGRGLG